MSKKFTPVVVEKNPPGGYLHLAYGITEDRRLYLADKMNKLTANIEGCVIVPMWERIEQLAEIADTHEEFVFCVVADMIWLQQSRRHTIL